MPFKREKILIASLACSLFLLYGLLRFDFSMQSERSETLASLQRIKVALWQWEQNLVARGRRVIDGVSTQRHELSPPQWQQIIAGNLQKGVIDAIAVFDHQCQKIAAHRIENIETPCPADIRGTSLFWGISENEQLPILHFAVSVNPDDRRREAIVVFSSRLTLASLVALNLSDIDEYWGLAFGSGQAFRLVTLAQNISGRNGDLVLTPEHVSPRWHAALARWWAATRSPWSPAVALLIFFATLSILLSLGKSSYFLVSTLEKFARWIQSGTEPLSAAELERMPQLFRKGFDGIDHRLRELTAENRRTADSLIAVTAREAQIQNRLAVAEALLKESLPDAKQFAIIRKDIQPLMRKVRELQGAFVSRAQIDCVYRQHQAIAAWLSEWQAGLQKKTARKFLRSMAETPSAHAENMLMERLNALLAHLEEAEAAMRNIGQSRNENLANLTNALSTVDFLESSWSDDDDNLMLTPSHFSAFAETVMRFVYQRNPQVQLQIIQDWEAKSPCPRSVWLLAMRLIIDELLRATPQRDSSTQMILSTTIANDKIHLFMTTEQNEAKCQEQQAQSKNHDHAASLLNLYGIEIVRLIERNGSRPVHLFWKYMATLAPFSDNNHAEPNKSLHDKFQRSNENLC